MFGKISTEFLNELGYDSVAHPREGIDPLLTMTRANRKKLRLWGPLTDLVRDGAPPDIERDQQGIGVSGGKTRKMEIGGGITLLQKLLAAVGIGGAGITVGYENAHSLEFVYENVLIDSVFPTAIWKYLRETRLDIDDDMKRCFDERGEAYIITDTVKSNSFGVIARDRSGLSIELDISSIKDLVGVNAKFDRTSDGTLKASFTGPKYLRFGFRSLPMMFVAEPEPRFVISPGEAGGPVVLRDVSIGLPSEGEPAEPEPTLEPSMVGKGVSFEME